MAKQATMNEVKPGVFQRSRTFLREVKAELDKVTWPSVDDLKVSTKVTLFLLAIMAGITFGFDQVFENFILLLLKAAS